MNQARKAKRDKQLWGRRILPPHLPGLPLSTLPPSSSTSFLLSLSKRTIMWHVKWWLWRLAGTSHKQTLSHSPRYIPTHFKPPISGHFSQVDKFLSPKGVYLQEFQLWQGCQLKGRLFWEKNFPEYEDFPGKRNTWKLLGRCEVLKLKFWKNVSKKFKTMF